MMDRVVKEAARLAAQEEAARGLVPASMAIVAKGRETGRDADEGSGKKPVIGEKRIRKPNAIMEIEGGRREMTRAESRMEQEREETHTDEACDDEEGKDKASLEMGLLMEMGNRVLERILEDGSKRKQGNGGNSVARGEGEGSDDCDRASASSSGSDWQLIPNEAADL